MSNRMEDGAKALEGVAAKVEAKTTTSAGTATDPCETAAVEDWSIALHKGLVFFPFWQQSILPVMWGMEQAWGAFPMDVWQIPQGVRATRTPSISIIRLRSEMIFRMN